jgi:outer membrane protein TolC
MASKSQPSFLIKPLRFLCLLLMVGSCLGAETRAPERVLHIAVIGSTSSKEASVWTAQIKAELSSLAGSRYALDFSEDAAATGDWNGGKARAALQTALGDAHNDLILVIDPLSISAAADASLPLSKPVIGGQIADPDLSPLPYGPDGQSTKKNFLVHAALHRSSDLIVGLRRILPFESLRILADPVDPVRAQAWCKELGNTLGMPVTLQLFAASPEDSASSLAGKTDPVLVMPSLRYTREERRTLYRLLAAQRIPAFSFDGIGDVMDGALAGGLPDCSARLARSVAVRLDRIVSGSDAVPLSCVLSLQQSLVVNESVALDTGVALDFRAHSSASFVNRKDGNQGATLTIQQAVLGAIEGSNSLKAKAAATTGALETKRMAKDALGPRLAATYRHQQVDRDRAEIAGVVLPETSVKAGLLFEQALIDTEAWSRAKAAREAYLAANYQEKAARLELVERASLSYLQHLSALALVRIAEENLASTAQNMELARLRQRTGSAGPEEILRFQSAEAQQRADLARARAQLEQARVALSRACSIDPDQAWKTEELSLDHPAFSFASRRVIARLHSEEDIRRFVTWCSGYALTHSPDLFALEQMSRAQSAEIQHKTLRNYVPKVSLGASYDRVLDMELGGPTVLEQLVRRGVLPMPSNLPDKNEWGVALTANLPLFTSGALSADLRKARSDLRQLEYTQADARQAIVARARASFYAMVGSYPSIELAAISAQSARKNLEISQKKYEQGTVSIISLLDAQTTAFSARQASELAVYRFLGDLVSFQRAIGWYELLSSPEEMDRLYREIEETLGKP